MTLRASISLLLAGLATTVTGVHCVMCNEIGCSAGLEWTAAPVGGGAVEAGNYELALTVEGEDYVIECTVLAMRRGSECVETQRGGDMDISVDMLMLQLTDEWNPDAPVEAFRVSIVDLTDLDDKDRSQSLRGPEEVAITLSRGSRRLVEDELEPEYTRDDDFQGDKRCGFCDEMFEATAIWMP